MTNLAGELSFFFTLFDEVFFSFKVDERFDLRLSYVRDLSGSGLVPVSGTFSFLLTGS